MKRVSSFAFALSLQVTCLAACFIAGPASAAELATIADEIVKIFAAAAISEHDQQSHGLSEHPPVMRRPVFSKAHGCLTAKFEIDPKLPQALKVGVFAGNSYPAWVRFSNDGAVGPDTVSVEKGGNPARGLAIKLVGVPGPKLLPGQESALTQDFILENHPAFFSATAADFLAFNQDFDGFMRTHPKESKILAEIGAAKLSDPLQGRYWTPTPYALGPDASMKYQVRPCSGQAAWQRRFDQMKSASYLRENLSAHVKAAKKPGDLCMDFYLQVFKDERSTPIDDASVAWDETLSPPIHAARLVFAPGQEIGAPQRVALCEALSFNGAHALAAHRPLGSINEVRQIVYRKINELRKTYNNTHAHTMTTSEPTSIEPGE